MHISKHNFIGNLGSVAHIGTTKSTDLTILKVANLANLINGLKLHYEYLNLVVLGA